jgi:hypothetical protein
MVSRWFLAFGTWLIGAGGFFCILGLVMRGYSVNQAQTEFYQNIGTASSKMKQRI